MKLRLAAIFVFTLTANCWSEQFDVLIKGGMVYDPKALIDSIR